MKDVQPKLTEIQDLVSERVEKERKAWAAPEEVGPENTQGISSKEILEALDQNEDGDARLYAKVHRDRFIFDHAVERWYEYAGHFWKEDLIDKATESLGAVIELYGIEVARQQWERLKCEKAGQTDKAKKHAAIEDALLKRIRALQAKGRKENVLSLARTGGESLAITGEEWDQNPWLVCCTNGVIDPRNGAFRSGWPGDFFRMPAPTEWKGLKEPAATWERFVVEIFSRNTELVDYVQRLLGYCTTGQTTEHILPILWGKGRNGKGTLLETLAYVLGPYTGQVEAELLLKQRFTRQSGGPTSDLMTLRGRRLVWASETDEGRKLNAGKLKWLTGGDTITGREVFGRRQLSFRPTHKLLLLTNSKPHARADDYALWQRIHLIPFELSFVNEPTASNERKADPTLLDKLKAEASGILAWLVRGCIEWQAKGLNPPEIVKTATEAYRQEEDTIKLFIDEKCTVEPEREIKAGDLYRAFKGWCEENGIRPISGTSFGKEFKERFGWSKTYKGVFYRGVSLLEA